MKDKPQGNSDQRYADGGNEDVRPLKGAKATGKSNTKCQCQNERRYDQVP
ncbi:MAG: hypothetical protein KAS83_03320 [Dehalococcoidia bacterium]|nr:hypothetical protein [Dehalococcoidia bacterium]